MQYLNRIDSPEDLKRLSLKELEVLCSEIREYMISCCSTNPGHLGASLGAVEIAVALHYVYNTPEDKLVWDVGHQAYAHKIITGRREAFKTNRKYNKKQTKVNKITSKNQKKKNFYKRSQGRMRPSFKGGVSPFEMQCYNI